MLPLCDRPPAAGELKNALGHWGISGGEAEAVVHYADQDGDGQINFNE